jgi:hypothetical protein
MKGILLATAASAAIFAGMTATFRLYRVDALAALMVYFCGALAFFVLFSIVPNDLGFLPLDLVADSPWSDFLTGFFALSASFFGGWLQLFNITDRGYSLRMLVDMLHTPDRSLTAEEIVNTYGDGRGLRWMYDTRISGILQTGLVTESDGTLALTSRGHRAANTFTFLRKLYRIGKHAT